MEVMKNAKECSCPGILLCVQLQKCCPSNVHATQVIHISSILQESKKYLIIFWF